MNASEQGLPAQLFLGKQVAKAIWTFLKIQSRSIDLEYSTREVVHKE